MPGRSHLTRGLTALLLAPGLAVLAAAPAHAATAPKRLGTVKVVSVDGPLELTVRPAKGGRAVRARVSGLDAPRAASPTAPAECGADLTLAALTRIAKPGRQLKVYAQTAAPVDGRLGIGARLRTSKGKSGSTLTAALIARGVARFGTAWLPATGGAPAGALSRNDEPLDDSFFEYEPENNPRGIASVQAANRGLGVWGACGRRFHAPLGTVAPPEPSWQIDGEGTLRSVGPVALSSDLRPGTVTRFGAVAAAAPDLELVRFPDGQCTGYSALAGTRFDGLPNDDTYDQRSDARPCAQQLVNEVETIGPVSTNRGPRTGSAVSALASFGLRVPSKGDDPIVPLGPSEGTSWPWQTSLAVFEGAITRYSAGLVVNYP